MGSSVKTRTSVKSGSSANMTRSCSCDFFGWGSLCKLGKGKSGQREGVGELHDKGSWYSGDLSAEETNGVDAKDRFGKRIRMLLSLSKMASGVSKWFNA